MTLFLLLYGIFVAVVVMWFLGTLTDALFHNGGSLPQVAAAALGSVAALAAAITLFAYLMSTPPGVLL